MARQIHDWPILSPHRVEGKQWKTHLNILLSRSQALEVITFSGQLTFSISGPRSRHVLESQHFQHSQHSQLSLPSAGLFLWQAPRREHACRCIGRWHPMALWHWAHDLLFFHVFLVMRCIDACRHRRRHRHRHHHHHHRHHHHHHHHHHHPC